MRKKGSKAPLPGTALPGSHGVGGLSVPVTLAGVAKAAQPPPQDTQQQQPAFSLGCRRTSQSPPSHLCPAVPSATGCPHEPGGGGPVAH